MLAGYEARDKGDKLIVRQTYVPRDRGRCLRLPFAPVSRLRGEQAFSLYFSLFLPFSEWDVRIQGAEVIFLREIVAFYFLLPLGSATCFRKPR